MWCVDHTCTLGDPSFTCWLQWLAWLCAQLKQSIELDSISSRNINFSSFLLSYLRTLWRRHISFLYEWVLVWVDFVHYFLKFWPVLLRIDIWVSCVLHSVRVCKHHSAGRLRDGLNPCICESITRPCLYNRLCSLTECPNRITGYSVSTWNPTQGRTMYGSHHPWRPTLLVCEYVHGRNSKSS